MVPKDRFLRAGGGLRHGLHPDIRHRDIDVRIVRSGAPLHAAERAALSHPALPEDGAIAIRIKRVHHA
jgi:hypothetical protein